MVFLICIYLDLLQGLFEGSLLRGTCGETFALLMCNGCQHAGAWGRSGAVMAFAQHTCPTRAPGSAFLGQLGSYGDCSGKVKTPHKQSPHAASQPQAITGTFITGAASTEGTPAQPHVKFWALTPPGLSPNHCAQSCLHNPLTPADHLILTAIACCLHQTELLN